MPFAQGHHPLGTGGDLRSRCPPISLRAVDQTRGWFYPSRGEHAPLPRARLPQRRVPRPAPGRQGPQDEQDRRQRRRADVGHRAQRRRRAALVPVHRDPPRRTSGRFSDKLVSESLRRFLLTLWNTYSFLRHLRRRCPTAGRRAARRPTPDDLRPIDRWILSRLDGTVDGGDRAPRGLRRHGRRPRCSRRFVDDLSNWYVRTGRRRFWGGRGRRERRRRRPRRRGRGVRAPCTSASPRIALLVAPVLPVRGRGDLRHARAPPTTRTRPRACTWPTGRAPRGRHDPVARGRDGQRRARPSPWAAARAPRRS